jgi:sugar phosphate isomerase/epimerase
MNTKLFPALLLVMLLLNVFCFSQKAGKKNLYAKVNLVAWCIVPFDNQNRNSEQRAQMLNDLGITKLAYDWREKHVPTFDEELNALKKHNIKLESFWYYSGPHPENDKNFAAIIDVLKRHNVKTQIWAMITGIEGLDNMTQEQKVEAVSVPVKYIANKAAEVGSTVALYNHGGWFGEPENQIAIIEHLKLPNLGIVYNFNHAEEQIQRFAEFYPKILPYLYALNITGLEGGYPAKVVPVGHGNIEFKVMKIIEESDYKGSIGIINEEFAPDAKDGLKLNLEGLKKYLKETKNSAALATY